jgi:soluble lytic murein transglycosylase
MPRKQTQVVKLIFAGAVIVGVSRCSTVSERSEFGLRAPSALSSEPVGRNFDNISDPAQRAVAIYRSAIESAKADRAVEACESFRRLALDLNLPEPIRILARVRALPLCPADLIVPLEKPPKWIGEENARAGLTNARRIGEPRMLANALREVSFFEKTQKLKVEKVQEALRLLDSVAKNFESDSAFQKERSAVLNRLVAIAPRFSLTLNDPSLKVDAMPVAVDLRNAREFDRARQLYSTIAKDSKRSDTERLRALDGLRMTYKLELRTPEFIAASNDWQTFAKKHFLNPGLKSKDSLKLKTYLDTRIQYARAIWTDHRSGEAKKILLETEKQLKNRISLHESMLIRARIAEEDRNFTETASILGQVNVDSLPDRATKAKFLWYKGWNLRRLPSSNDTKEAIATLELAQKFEDRHSDLTRDMYWTARLYKESGDEEKARCLFTDLADFSQFGIYGILAQRELKLPFQSLKTEGLSGYNPRQSSPIADHIRVPVDWFIVLGEFEVGRRFVESFPSNEIYDSSWSLEKKEAVLVMLSRLEQHITVGVRVDELSPDDRKRLLLKRPELLFPLPYRSRIVEEATKQGIPPALVYSIMRQESMFNTFARSPADAFGLMQLIPEMAAKAAKGLGVDFHGPEDLYDPDKNIALGTGFLKTLFKRHGDRFVLSVSAYNASDKAIEGWVRTRMRNDPLEFIEEIPYDETRLYVKLVMRNFVTYQRRLSSTPVEFPEDVLRLNAVSK